MPEALSSFLLSVSIIVAMVVFLPCIESLAKLLRRSTAEPSRVAQTKPAKAYTREVA